jgi:YD repeat-containing protein
VNLTGNFALPVEVKRTFKGRQSMFSSDLAMGDWELEIPMVTTEVMGSSYGHYSGPWGVGKACSNRNDLDWIGYNDATFFPNEYWNGDIINIPGKVNERLLFSNSTIANFDDFKRVSKSGWRVKCIDTVDNIEGYEVHSPDGTVYTLDVPKLVYVDQLKKNSRYKAYMMASKVEDRFGNTVTYQYDGKGRITSIVASDGRTITFDYHYDVGAGSSIYHRNLISDVNVNGRTWQYHYAGSDTQDTSDDGYSLTGVTRPDGKQWAFNLGMLSFFKPRSVLDANNALDVCKRYDDTRTINASVTHPNGVVGQFNLKEVLNCSSNVDQ